MGKVLLLLILAVALVAAGCESPKASGDREFIPGRGWVPISH